MATGIVIKKMVSDDIQHVAELLLQCNLSYWSEIDLELEIQRTDSIAIVAKKDKKLIGFILARLIMSQAIVSPKKEKYNHKFSKKHVEIEVYNIAVSKEFRRTRVGNLLIKSLLEHSKPSGSIILWLEVRESNTQAIDFYKSNSFAFCYKRKNFYTSPVEDAIVMKMETKCLNIEV